jgi:hypothetical protein
VEVMTMTNELDYPERRAFIRRAATLGATAPAAALLLSASGRTVSAGNGVILPGPYGRCPPGTIRQGDICVPDTSIPS